MFELPTQLSTLLLQIANVCALNLMEQDDDDTNQEISNDESEDAGESTLSSNMEEDDLDIQQQVIHPNQSGRDKNI